MSYSELLRKLEFVMQGTYGELHRLGTSSPELAGNNDLAALGTALHDEPKHTVACSSDGKTVEELVAEGLALGDGGKTTVLDLGGVERDGVLGELEALLDERGELANAATLLSENLLCVRGADDDVGNGGRDADLDTGVTLLGEFALEELVELGVEHTVCTRSKCQPWPIVLLLHARRLREKLSSCAPQFPPEGNCFIVQAIANSNSFPQIHSRSCFADIRGDGPYQQRTSCA